MSMNRKLFSILILFTLTAFHAAALKVPPLQGRINDRAGMLSSSAAADLEEYLAAVERASGVQIALLTIDSLEGESLESYSLKVVDSWELGQKGEDNGVLLLLTKAERKIRIETGYGLEGELTDAVSGYIIREAIVPELKNGNFDAGISNGLHAIGGVVSGEAPISQETINQSEQSRGGSPFFPLIVFLIFTLVNRIAGYRANRRRGMSPLAAFLLGSMMGSVSRRSSFGGHSSFSSGGFSSGGFSGGGFSGGGGSFGGGGASGGW